MWLITIRSLFVATALLSLFAGTISAVATDQLQLIWTREVAKGIPSYVGNGIATDGKSSLYLSSEGPYGAVWLERRSLAGDLLWRRTLGTPEYESVAGLVTGERGGVVLAGNTYGSYLGPNKGSSDVWFARYTKHGVPTLGKQFGTGYSDYPSDVSVDGDGNIYSIGRSIRDSGEEYSWINKYSRGGILQWQKRLRTEIGTGRGIELDVAGNVIAAGATASYPVDVWIMKFLPDGERLWIRQLGRSGESSFVTALKTDGDGNIVLGGNASNAASQSAAWISEVAADGTVLWTRHDPPANNYADDLVVDHQGNVYFLGSSYDAISGVSTPWLRKYDDAGHQLWEKRIGEADWGYARGITMDDGDKLYILWNNIDTPSGFGKVRLSKYCTRC